MEIFQKRPKLELQPTIKSLWGGVTKEFGGKNETGITVGVGESIGFCLE